MGGPRCICNAMMPSFAVPDGLRSVSILIRKTGRSPLALGRKDHFLSPLCDKLVLMMIDITDKITVAGHVGLITVSIVTWPWLRPDLDSRISVLAEFEITIELKIRRASSGPGQIVCFSTRIVDILSARTLHTFVQTRINSILLFSFCIRINN